MDVEIEKPTLYRIIFRYVNQNPSTVTAGVTLTPDVSVPGENDAVWCQPEPCSYREQTKNLTTFVLKGWAKQQKQMTRDGKGGTSI